MKLDITHACLPAALAVAAFVSLGAQAPKPKHINRAIELLEAGSAYLLHGIAHGTGRHLRAGQAGRADVGRLHQLRHGARAVRRQGPRRLHARAGGGRARPRAAIARRP